MNRNEKRDFVSEKKKKMVDNVNGYNVAQYIATVFLRKPIRSYWVAILLLLLVSFHRTKFFSHKLPTTLKKTCCAFSECFCNRNSWHGFHITFVGTTNFDKFEPRTFMGSKLKTHDWYSIGWYVARKQSKLMNEIENSEINWYATIPLLHFACLIRFHFRRQVTFK